MGGYRSTSRVIRPYATLETPEHPYPSIVAPRSPNSPISFKILVSKSKVSETLVWGGTFVAVGFEDSWLKLLLTVIVRHLSGALTMREEDEHDICFSSSVKREFKSRGSCQLNCASALNQSILSVEGTFR
jgi:hypothetical protein